MSDLLARALAPARAQAAELFGLMQEEERAQIRRWEEEKPSLTSLVHSLSASCDIIKSERKKAKARLQEIQSKIDKLQQKQLREQQQQQQDAQHTQDLVDLQATLVDLNNKVLDADIAIQKVTAEAASCQRAEEKDIYTTSLVVLQDTRRLLQAEISGLRATIMRMDAKARLEAERQGAEDSGFSAVTRLDEQLVKTSSRLNRAKQQLYFPECKGYRFSTGSSGVFFAAHDLFISELSGRFDFDLELVKRPEGNRVRISVTLGGAAGGSEESEQPAGSAQFRPSSANSTSSSQSGRPSGRIPRAGDSHSPSGSVGGASGPGTEYGAGPRPGSSSQSGGKGQEQAPPGGSAGVSKSASQQDLSVSSTRSARDTAPPASRAPSGPSAPSAPFAAMAAAALAAKGMANSGAGADLQRPPAPVSAGVQTHQASTGNGSSTSTPFATLPPFPHSSKPLKGEMVASFFSGLSKSKGKLKSMLATGSSSSAGAGANLSSDPGQMPGQDGKFKLSKLAKVLSSRADRLTDRLTDKFRPLSTTSKVGMSLPEPVETIVSTGDLVLGVGPDTPDDAWQEAAPASGPPPPEPDASTAPADPWDSMSLGMEAFESRPSRRGIYVQLLGEGVELVGERGSKIPDISMRELLLEVEVSMTAVLEYNPLVGWQAPDKINLSIIQLHHKMRGSSLPLPSSILRGLLGLYLPGVLTSTLISILPTELGAYVEASGEPVKASGELRVLGQQLSTYVASMWGEPGKMTAEQQSAAARARSLLGLSEGQAQALAEIFGGRSYLLDKPRPLSICELCRFFVKYSRSRMWSAMCNVWNKALQVCFDQLGVSERFTFGRFMDVAVARLARKPLRVSLTMHHLSAALNVDVGLATLRDFFERTVRELHKKAAQGGEEAALPREPIEVQLEMLSLWHASLSQLLRTFKARFHSMGCSILAHADHEVFQLGAEGVHYDGPLKVRVPLEVMVDPDNSLVWDVKLPDKEKNSTSMLAMLQETLKCLAVAQPGEAAKAGSVGAQIDQLLANSQAKLTTEEGPFARSSFENGLQLSLPQIVGQVSLRRIILALKLDEERVAELLSASARPVGSSAPKADTTAASSTSSSTSASASPFPSDVKLASQLLSCFGDLFTTSLDVGWRSEPEADGSNPCRCMLTVSNNDVTRVRADVESLMFQSSVSPKLAVRMLYTVVANIMLRFYNQDSFQLAFWYKLFSQLHEYLGKESLDVTACVSAHAEVIRPTKGSTKRSGPNPTPDDDPILRVMINGGSSQQGLTQVAPFSLVNEVNLLTVLDSFKLFESTPSQ